MGEVTRDWGIDGGRKREIKRRWNHSQWWLEVIFSLKLIRSTLVQLNDQETQSPMDPTVHWDSYSGDI